MTAPMLLAERLLLRPPRSEDIEACWTDIIHTIAPDNAESIALARRLGSTDRGPTSLPAPLEALPVDNRGQSAADRRARRAADG